MSGSEYLLVVVWLWIFAVGPALSSEPGPQDCMETINLREITNNSKVFVSSNKTVCFECGFTILGHRYSINRTEIVSNSTLPAKVVTDQRLFDILVVFDAGKVFSYYFPTSIKCNENRTDHGGNIYLTTVLLQDLNPPLVEKESTTITEGSTVNLRCDGSNSIPQPSLKWISPNGTVISETRQLEMVNITENEAGLYTCIATLPLSNSTKNTSLSITVLRICRELQSNEVLSITMPSNTMGSTATYQCIDGSTDVYTTLCTSQGVWDPDPFSSIKCVTESPTVITTDPVVTGVTESPTPEGINLIIIVAPIAGVISLVVCITVVVVIIVTCLLRKKHTKSGSFRTEFQMEDKRGGAEYKITFSDHSSYNEDQTTKAETFSTALNDQGNDQGVVNTTGLELYSVPRSTPFLTQDDVKTVDNPEYNALPTITPQMIETVHYSSIPEQEIHHATSTTATFTADAHPTIATRINPDNNIPMTNVPTMSLSNQLVDEYSRQPDKSDTAMPVQILPTDRVEQRQDQVEDGSSCQPLHVTPQEMNEATIFKPVTKPLKPPGELMTRVKEKTHEELPLLTLPPTVKKYVEVGIHPTPTPNKPLEPDQHRVKYATLDINATAINLDVIVIQLGEVIPYWKSLGAAVGLENLEEIPEHVNNDHDAMVEVVDGWLAKLHPQKLTWNAIADTVESIGHDDLANSLRNIRVAGQLPIQVSHDISEAVFHRDHPPPVPPHKTKKSGEDSTNIHQLL